MYKILILRRGGEDPLWGFHKITEKVMIDDPSGKTDLDTGEVIKIETEVTKVFEADNLTSVQTEYDKINDFIGEASILPVGILKVESNTIITP